MDAYRGKHDEDAIATGNGALDDLAVVGRAWYDSNAALERVELLHTGLSSHANHLVAAIQRVLHDVLPEPSRSSDEAHSLHVRDGHSIMPVPLLSLNRIN